MFRLVRAPIRVMTWNVKAEYAMDPATGALANQVTTIGSLRPDVLGLQESCVKQAQALRRRLLVEYGLRYRIAYGSVARKPYCGPLGGAFGQMILSRHPISGSRTHPLPPSCADLPGPFCQNDQRRNVLATTVALPGASVRVLDVHLASKGDGLTRQVAEVARIARPHRRAVVLGDFNRKPHQIGYRLRPFRDVGPRVDTRPGVGRIDYIFLRGLRSRTARCTRCTRPSRTITRCSPTCAPARRPAPRSPARRAASAAPDPRAGARRRYGGRAGARSRRPSPGRRRGRSGRRAPRARGG
jgi:endonuclease/exonuclease/phosphatase family metal-dependent hydrolase